MRYLEHLREARRRKRGERGAALLEFAIALPIFIALLMVIFDAGLGYSASRSSASAARSAARVGALAGDDRLADFRILDALRAEYGEGEDVQRIMIYRSDPSNSTGLPPDSCGDAGDKCSLYAGSALANLSQQQFTNATITETLDDGTVRDNCTSDAPDKGWCSKLRRADEGAFLGVYVETISETTTGLLKDEFTLGDRAVFALYFAPLPVEG